MHGPYIIYANMLTLYRDTSRYQESKKYKRDMQNLPFFFLKFSDENDIAKLVVGIWRNCSSRLCQSTLPEFKCVFEFYYFAYIFPDILHLYFKQFA